MRFLVVVARTESGYSAYVADLPTCTATGATLAEVERAIRETLVIALKELRCAGQGRLEPEAQPVWIEVEP